MPKELDNAVQLYCKMYLTYTNNFPQKIEAYATQKSHIFNSVHIMCCKRMTSVCIPTDVT